MLLKNVTELELDDFEVLQGLFNYFEKLPMSVEL